MVKTFTTCVGCERPRFVNYAGLCKDCNRDPRHAHLVRRAIGMHEHELEVAQEAALERQAAEAEKAAKEALKVAKAAEGAEEPETPAEEKK